MTDADQKEGYRIRRKRSDGQTTVEYLVILLVMIGLLIAIALFFSPRLRNAVKDLVARIECALNVSGGSGCGAAGQGTSSTGPGSAGSTGQGGSGSPGGSSGSTSGEAASSGGGGSLLGGGAASSGRVGVIGWNFHIGWEWIHERLCRGSIFIIFNLATIHQRQLYRQCLRGKQEWYSAECYSIELYSERQYNFRLYDYLLRMWRANPGRLQGGR